MTRLDRLLEISGPALAGAAPDPVDWPGGLGVELTALLARVNGFYAFESALHVWPSGGADLDIAGWNADQLWRDSYEGLADGLLFFAEDVFGGQFALAADHVLAFDPETGERTVVADSIEGWAATVLQDYQFQTGYPLAHQWQQQHGGLPAGQRLLPKRPFVLGGKYEIDNLYPLDAVQGMRLRGELAVQLHDLPDGATVKFTIVE